MMVNQYMSSIWTKKQDKAECGIWPRVCRQGRKGSPVKLGADSKHEKSSPKYNSSSPIFLLRVAPGFDPCDMSQFKQSITFGLSALQPTLLMEEGKGKKHSSRRYKKKTHSIAPGF